VRWAERIATDQRSRAANKQDLQHREGVKKTDVEIGPISRRPARGSDGARTAQQRCSTSLRISPAGSRSARPLRQAQGHTRKTAQHRSLDFARDFGSRLGRSPQQAKTGLAADPDGRRENASAQGPSSSLRISPAGSDARKTAQLYKKRGSFRHSVSGVDFRTVRC